MRLFSTIFVTYIFLLTTIPPMSMALSSMKTKECKTSCCHSKKSCHKQKAPMSQQHKGCCENGMCNPFMSCCNGSALTANNCFIPTLVFTNQKFSALAENSISAFLADAWHPPKAFDSILTNE